ncbi:MAG: TIGR00341 family protein [Candidatus Saliniplasma sp.]
MLRLIEMLIPEEKKTDAETLLEDDEKVYDFWFGKVSEKKVQIKVLVDAEKNQTVIDKIEDNFGDYDGFRLLMFDVQASLPIQDQENEQEKKKSNKEEEGKETKGVSREELYDSAIDEVKLSSVYLLLIGLSAIVASIGVLRSDVAVIIGAMVIAPMLGPNVGLSLATTLADVKLAKRALKSNLIGILLGFAIAVILGLFLTSDPTTSPELMARTNVGYGDVALALAAGSAGALAYTRGISATLIGVMVALALVPTLVSSGLLLGAGYYTLSFLSLMLFLVNLICINLSGVLTFIVQGIEPNSWWEAEKAKRLTRNAIIIWVSLLLALVAVIFYMSIG